MTYFHLLADSKLFLWIHSETFLEYLSGYVGYKKLKETTVYPQGAIMSPFTPWSFSLPITASWWAPFEASVSNHRLLFFQVIPHCQQFLATTTCDSLTLPPSHSPLPPLYLSQLKFQSPSLYSLSLTDPQLHCPSRILSSSSEKTQNPT